MSFNKIKIITIRHLGSYYLPPKIKNINYFHINYFSAKPNWYHEQKDLVLTASQC